MRRILDLRETICPFTQLKAIEAFHGLSPGESLRILMKDPASVEAIVRAVKGDGSGDVDVRSEADAFAVTVVRGQRREGEAK